MIAVAALASMVWVAQAESTVAPRTRARIEARILKIVLVFNIPPRV